MTLEDYLDEDPVRPAKILFLDIECSPTLAWVWQQWDASVLDVERDSFMMAVSWRWGHQERTFVKALPHFARYTVDPYDDRDLVAFTLGLLDQADVICGHNVKAFDLKKIAAFACVNGLSSNLPSPYRVIDTLTLARKHFKFLDNRLGSLCKLLGLPLKEDSGGMQTWLKCMNGDPAAWRKMVKYARQDTAVLPALFDRLRPYATGLPALHYAPGKRCSHCGSGNLEEAGSHRTKVSSYVAWRCTDCGALSRDRFSLAGAGPDVVPV